MSIPMRPPPRAWFSAGFFFSSRGRHTMSKRDWSSDGCSSDLSLLVILTKAREITNSDAGSLYLVEHDGDGNARLFFALAQNDSLEVPFRATTLPLSSTSEIGRASCRERAKTPAVAAAATEMSE